MKKNLIVVVFLLCLQHSFAQVDPVGDFNRHIAEKWSGEYIRISQYQVKGTPYFLGESFPGSITYEGNSTLKDKKLLFDLYSQKAGVEVNHAIFEAELPVLEFTLQLPEKFGSQILVFKNCSLFGHTTMKGYLNVLVDGNRIALLKRYSVKLSPDPTNTLAKDKKVFEQYYEYYIYNKAKNELNKVKLKEKDIFKEMGNEQLIKEYVDRNDLQYSREEDVKRLVHHYNSL